MLVYKLFRKMKDGSLAPLFINKRLRLQVGVWYDAEYHPTKGFQPRKGWHCCVNKSAPHLSEKGRVWCLVEVEDYTLFSRPQSQGGEWVLANKMKIVEELSNVRH